MRSDQAVFVLDDYTPEDVAMLQALYSRSDLSVEEQMRKRIEGFSGPLMEKYYVNYNHKSIGDCGSTTVFLEGVSMLAAKAIQDNPLYCGQETSTRFVDMSTVLPVDPLNRPDILESLMLFYATAQQAVMRYVRERHPQKPDEKDNVYEGAVKARTFDILRAWLPAGTRTQLSWHSNLRQLADKLAYLLHHPLQELRELAGTVLNMLQGKYPHSFGKVIQGGMSGAWEQDGQMTRDAYRKWMMEHHNYARFPSYGLEPVMTHTLNIEELSRYSKELMSRPRGAELPHWMSELGQITFMFDLDYGSFRDLQRHRNGVVRMPLLTMEIGFHPWYLQQLPPAVRDKAIELLGELHREIPALDAPDELKQYYIPMGFRVPTRNTFCLPAALYVCELRSVKTIHPTYRKPSQECAKLLGQALPVLAMHADLEPDDWTVRRGAQTIVEKV